MSPWRAKSKLSREEIAQILEDFLAGSGHLHDWDGFTLGMTFDDPELEKIRMRCAGLTAEFPPEQPNHYCNDRGLAVIREYIRVLRNAPVR